MFQDSFCIKPIEYVMNISVEVQSTSLNVNSRVKLNVSCIQQTIKIYVGHCNVEYDFIINTNIPYTFVVLVIQVIFYERRIH